MTYDLIYAYYYNSWVYSAAKAIGMSISDIPIVVAEHRGRSRKPKSICRFVKQDLKGEIKNWSEALSEYKAAEKVELIDDHPVLDLLADPNPEADLTQQDLLEAIVIVLETDGNSYVEKIWSGAKNGLPSALWPKVDPRSVVVVPGEKRLVAGYIYQGTAKPVIFNWDEMMHFMYFAPLNPFYGMAAARVLRTQLISETKAIDWNRLFFEHDATPGGLLSSDERLSRDDVNMMRAVWNDRYRGPGRAHQVAILGQGTKYQALTPTHKDMGFQELRNFTKKEVQACYGVPSIVMGDYEDANRASAMTMARLYYLNTVLPRLGKIESILTRQLLNGDKRYSLMFNVGTIDALQEDILLRTRAGRYLKELWTVPNEVREFMGLPRIEKPGMDDVWVDPKMVRMGETPANNGGEEE